MTWLLAALVRGLVCGLVRAVYRIRVIGAENVPRGGPVLLAANHTSYADSLVIATAVERPLRFVMWRVFFRKWGVSQFARLFGTIDISHSDSPARMRKSVEAVAAALKGGDVVCLFPEGEMTRTGHLHAFKRGLRVIARRGGAPIVPVYVDGLWGSVFSFEGGRFFWKWPRWPRRPVTVSFGPPLPPDSAAARVRRAALELGVQAYALRKAHQRLLHCEFWLAARRRWWRPCMADSSGAELTWGRALAGSLAISRWLRRRCADKKMVGMMMPASVGAALINVAAIMAGKVPVNLNFTGTWASIGVAMKRCGLRTVFTTRKLLEKLEMPERAEFVYLEDVLRSLSKKERTWSFLLALLTPMRVAQRWLMHRGSMDDLATIMFTSGSTGEPKGVMLSHHNVVSNVEAMAEVLQYGPKDTIMGVLPPFHSFGFTTTLWLPLISRVRVVYHPSPLDAKGVGRMVEKYHATMIMGAPSFYVLYTRGCKPEQFRSLRLAISGAQKLLPSVADAFEERFGLPISEGYGCTELSPVVAVNVPDVRHKNVFEEGTRKGSVGRPLPGLAVKVVDRETFAPVAEGARGIVLIKGPNVMMGYMDDPKATAEVIRDGWYVTNDIGAVDEDGFLYIHDRVSRFSKIGGEMVPHTAVEEALYRAASEGDWRFAVVNVPDHVKGEKLAVLYSGSTLNVGQLLRDVANAGIPPLWTPAEKDFIHVDEIPLLGSGKTNLGAARKVALERLDATR